MENTTDDELIAWGVKALREELHIMFDRVEEEVNRRGDPALIDRFKDIQSDPENTKYEPDSTTGLDPFDICGGGQFKYKRKSRAVK